MSLENIIKALLPINCFYNYEIEDDGRCHCSICVMNQVPDLKEKIKIDGCCCFNMPEVKEKIEIQAYEGVTMDKEIIEKLKDKEYVRAFGLMTPEEQEILRRVGWKNRLQLATNYNYENKFFYEEWIDDCDKIQNKGRHHLTFAIKPDYQPEPEYVDLEIVALGGFLGIKSGNTDIFPFPFTHLHCLPSLPTFEFLHSPGETFKITFWQVATKINEGKKVYARFRT